MLQFLRRLDTLPFGDTCKDTAIRDVGHGQYHHQIRRQRFGALRWEGLRRKSRKGTKRIERNWGPTDWQECNGEDNIARLESRQNTFRSKYSCMIRCLQCIDKTILLRQH